MGNIQFNEKTVKEFTVFLDNDLNFVSKNLELMNKQLNDELEKIVIGFVTYLDNDLKFVSDNLRELNDALNEALKETFENDIKQHSYFKEHRFSPLKSSTNVMGYKKTTRETAYTYLLSHFLKESEFKNYLFKSILHLIGITKECELKDAESEVALPDGKSGRVDVLCICEEIDESGKNELLIEAKINHKEGKDQTQRYFDAKKDKAFAFLYLTVNETTPECNEFQNIIWIDLAAAFYAGYNSYKYHYYKINEKWSEVNFGWLEDSHEGIFLQMWLSNILTYLYHMKDIEKFNSNEYDMFIISARFMEKYKEVMGAING